MVDENLGALEALLEHVPRLRAAGVTHVKLGDVEIEVSAVAPPEEPESRPEVDPQQRRAEIEREREARRERDEADLRDALFYSAGGAPPLIGER